MNHYEVVYFIRDQMLTNPEINASFVYDLEKAALIDDKSFKLMSDWMKESNNPMKQKMIEELMIDHLKSAFECF